MKTHAVLILSTKAIVYSGSKTDCYVYINVRSRRKRPFYTLIELKEEM
jgi:hypothetical protein